jgi:integrase/recombinase XerD
MIEVNEEMGRPREGPTGPAWYRDLTSAWSRSLSRRGRGARTQRTYWWLLRDFGRWLEHCRIVAPEHLVIEVLYSWQDDLIERKVSASTLALAATILRGLMRWAARERYGVPPDMWERIDPVERAETRPRPLEPEVRDLILAHYARRGRGLEQLRDRALFLFLLTTGSRITAALSLDRLQFAAGAGPLIVRQKGGGEHVLLPSTQARAWTLEYLRSRGVDDQPALWIRIGPRGRHRLTMDTANRIWAELCAELRIPLFTSHVLKHTAVTELSELTESDTAISEHVGWKGTAMMRRYRQLRDDRRQQLVDRLDGLVPAVPDEPPPPARRRPRVQVMKGKPPRRRP